MIGDHSKVASTSGTLEVLHYGRQLVVIPDTRAMVLAHLDLLVINATQENLRCHDPQHGKAQDAKCLRILGVDKW